MGENGVSNVKMDYSTMPRMLRLYLQVLNRLKALVDEFLGVALEPLGAQPFD